jgi:hypothetical protein
MARFFRFAAFGRVGSASSIPLLGALAGGTRFSQTTPIAEDGAIPVYVSLYEGGGLLFGGLNLSGATSDPGALTWIKTPFSKPITAYLNGFTNVASVIVSPYANTPP